MKITREFIESHRTARGGFTFAQCQALGASWPPVKGWLKRAVQVEHTAEALDLFVKFAQRAPTKPERREQRSKNYEQLSALGVQATHETIKAKKQKSPKQKKTPSVVVARRPVIGLDCDPASKEFLNTFQWRSLRVEVLKLYGPKCMCCGATPQTGAQIHVDHVKPRKLFPELALDKNNLQILCHECNHGKGNWDQTDWRPETRATNVLSIAIGKRA